MRGANSNTIITIRITIRIISFNVSTIDKESSSIRGINQNSNSLKNRIKSATKRANTAMMIQGERINDEMRDNEVKDNRLII